MRDFTLQELSFVRKHWQIDMSSRELAHYFHCDLQDIQAAASSMKLKINAWNVKMNKVFTPYKPQIAINVKKATNPTLSDKATENVEEVRSANP